jgi:hypothetical protein
MSDISRVTQNSASMLMVSDMESDLSGLTLLQEQAASGKALNQPSDNPTGTSEVLSMNSQIGRYQQYATNAGDGLSRLQTASGALNSVTEALNQVQTEVLSGANASASDASESRNSSGTPGPLITTSQFSQALTARRLTRRVRRAALVTRQVLPTTQPPHTPMPAARRPSAELWPPGSR